MRVLKSGLLYFALVFAAGFALGPVRVLWAVPRFGERTAELMEAPLMLAVVALTGRWIARRFEEPKTSARLLAVGLVALAMLLAAELTMVLSLRGLSVSEYVRSRDPVGGAVYVALLLLFALMPLLA
ncbi:MAG TPA: hypothetical protein VJ921_13725, partial [Vicinamibacteria bacterium]|nr:hypothetical protein [Vicinamibacteria bacterium]